MTYAGILPKPVLRFPSKLASSPDTIVSSFVAIDFETANQRSDSACAVGLTAVRGGRIEVAQSFLIRPLASHFAFTASCAKTLPF